MSNGGVASADDDVDLLLLVADVGVERSVRDAIAARPGTRYDVLSLPTVDDALSLLDIEQPAVALLQVDDHDPEGASAVVARVRLAAPTLPLVAVTATDDLDLGERLIVAGAQDFLARGDIGEAVVRRTVRHARERHRLLGSLEQLAITDHLTGLHNRRGLELLSATVLADARRHHRDVTVLFADLDGLKDVNDTQGHDAGDLLIRAAARLLKSELRSSDIIARLGGDEFAALLIDADKEAVSRRLRSALATHPDRRLSMSFALTSAPAEEASLSALLEAADAAMYAQKRARRQHRR